MIIPRGEILPRSLFYTYRCVTNSLPFLLQRVAFVYSKPGHNRRQKDQPGTITVAVPLLPGHLVTLFSSQSCDPRRPQLDTVSRPVIPRHGYPDKLGSCGRGHADMPCYR